MTTVTLDATTQPPTVLPAGAAMPMGDVSLNDRVIRYWYSCAFCRTHAEVAADEVVHHECPPAQATPPAYIRP